MTREDLVSEKESLQLSKDIAVEARTDELKSFAENFIKDNGFDSICHVVVCTSDTSAPPVFYIESNKDVSRSFKFYVSFNKRDDGQSYKAYVRSTSIDGYDYSSSNAHDIEKLKLFCFLAENTHRFTDLVNTATFKSYADDIQAYYASQKSIEKFDDDAREAKLREIQESFKAGMRICYGPHHSRSYPITRVSAKKVFLSGYTYRNGLTRKSEWKDRAAKWILSGTWKLEA